MECWTKCINNRNNLIKDANLWINKVLGTVKTKDEAQAIVNGVVTLEQAAWDALSDQQKSNSIRPDDIILEE